MMLHRIANRRASPRFKQAWILSLGMHVAE
jgi:hypothetical protein